MHIRFLCVSLCLMVSANMACWATGLQPPAAEQIWPQWQARVGLWAQPSVNASLGQGLSLVRQTDAPSAPRSLQGVSLLGDYYLNAPGANGLLGGLRASGGVLLGAGTVPSVAASKGALSGGGRWILSSGGGDGKAGSSGSIGNGSGNGLATGSAHGEASIASPYLGLGFTGAAWRSSLAFSADLGLLAERPSGAVSGGRALLGNQGLENALREFRLSPLFQVGVRYAF
jgi:hypothetical protein